MYTDTGLTVSFILTRIHDIAATDNAAANLADNAVTIGDAIEGLGRAAEDMNEVVADWIANEVQNTPARYIHDAAIAPNNPYEINVRTLEELEEAIREMSITADLTAEQVIIPNNSVDGTVTLNLNGTQINMDLLNEMVGDVSVAPQRKKRSKEKELNPGDTKLLDEYLHSFMKGGC